MTASDKVNEHVTDIADVAATRRQIEKYDVAVVAQLERGISWNY
jgi:hypothetical protein